MNQREKLALDKWITREPEYIDWDDEDNESEKEK